VLLSLDPGLNSPGIAAFFGGDLVHAERVAIPASFAELEDGDRWLRVALTIAARGTAIFRRDTTQSCLGVIFERPQWYSKAKSKGDPNQLAGVAGVAACTVGVLSQAFALRVHSPTPAEWIGQLSKVCPACRGKAKKKCTVCRGSAWATPRGRRIRSRLSPAELDLVPDQNDAIDAVGLGLWALGRLEPRSVLSNGRDGR
jgi:hypothetical protein